MAARAQRFAFIDEFRGLIGVMMALGHSNYYLNRIWLQFDPVDPTFDSVGQFALRYMGYLCAPGFLMMNGAMTYWTYRRRRRAGETDGQARWDLVQRGLFLVAVQGLWVNASWSGFAALRLDHLGIIATIGLSMLLLTPLVTWPWWGRLALAAGLLLGHPFLLRLPYDPAGWQRYAMELLVTSGEFNKYPVLPWFALALLGSVMAHFWFERWRDPGTRAARSLALGLASLLAAVALRLAGGFGNLFPHDGFGSWSFFLVQKYPPSLAHQLWFAGAIVFMVGLFDLIGQRLRVLRLLGVVGRVPLFFYAVHIPLLAIALRRLSLWPYRGGAVAESLLGWAVLMAVMLPLAWWFGGVKRRSRSWLIRMI